MLQKQMPIDEKHLQVYHVNTIKSIEFILILLYELAIMGSKKRRPGRLKGLCMGVKSDGGANWERKLDIITGAGGYEKDDKNHSRYEPTAYAVLNRLAQSGYIRREDVLVDYGCGKGRVGFFMNHALGCRTIGVEYDAALHARALENLASYSGKRDKVSFVLQSAQDFDASQANCFYFFNPFSEVILRSVLCRILESWYAVPRDVRLFFYYPVDAYLNCMMNADAFHLLGEIDCRDLFGSGDEREKILIYDIAD